MGMGRNSSRIATRRIANYAGDDLDQLIESTGYIQNYSSNYSSSKAQSASTNSNSNNTSSTIENQKTETETKPNSTSQSTGSNDITSIINSVATNKSNESNGSSTKAPTAKRMKTKKVLSNPSTSILSEMSSANVINNSWQPSASSEDTLSQEAELIKYSANGAQINFTSTYSESISPSTNSSSSSLFSRPSVNTTIAQGPTFAEPACEVPKNEQIDGINTEPTSTDKLNPPINHVNLS